MVPQQFIETDGLPAAGCEHARAAIIGAGPIGIELAVELKCAGFPYVHLEAGSIASTVSGYPRQMHFHSMAEKIAIAGMPFQVDGQGRPTREQYLAYLRSVVQKYALPIRCYERVEQARRLPGGLFELHTSTLTGARCYRVERVIVAFGAMHRPRRLDIPGEDLPRVSHYFSDPHPYFGQRVFVVGGKNSAIEAAIRCHAAGAEVTLCYRRPEFDPGIVKPWLLPEINGLIRDGRIRMLAGMVPLEILPGRVRAQNREGGEVLDVAADFVLLLTGYEQDTSLLEMLGVEMVTDDRRPLFDDTTMETNVPGVFVAGTATMGSPVGKIRVIIENCHVHATRIAAALTAERRAHEVINE